MIKKIITTSLVVSALLLSACGNNGKGESTLKTQEMLDSRNFDGVIAKLENNTTTLSQGDSIALASAYMGKAGFSLSAIIGIVATNANGAGDAFTAFVKDAIKNSSPKAITELEKAKGYYKAVVQSKCSDKATLSTSESDICLYSGLANLAQTTVSIDTLTANIVDLGNKSNGKLQASVCAMQYAFDGSTGSGCTVVDNGNISFIQSNKTYKSINVPINGNSYEYLLTTSVPRTTVITKGFCPLNDFAKIVSTKPADTSYHVCPITQTAGTQEITTQKVIVDAINNSTDLISAIGAKDVKTNIDTFKKEILTANGRGNDANTTLTASDIIKYLENKNK